MTLLVQQQVATDIQANQLTGTIQIPINNDSLDEADETFTVTITSATGAELSSTTTDLTITVTIADDDIPELSIFAIGTGITKEGTNATADFRITSDILPRTGLIIQYLPVSTSFLPDGVSAEKQSTPEPLTFIEPTNGDPINTTLRVSLDSDTIAEANGTVQVTLQSEIPNRFNI